MFYGLRYAVLCKSLCLPFKAYWASECPDVKNYKWRLNPVLHRMLYSCTHMATVGFKGLSLCWNDVMTYTAVSWMRWCYGWLCWYRLVKWISRVRVSSRKVANHTARSIRLPVATDELQALISVNATSVARLSLIVLQHNLLFCRAWNDNPRMCKSVVNVDLERWCVR